MDEDLIRAVATAAAGLIVRAMGTAAWRGGPGPVVTPAGARRRRPGTGGGGQLEESAHTLARADPEERERRAAEVEAEWRGTLQALLRSDPELVEAVREIVGAHPSASPVAAESVTQTATVWGGVG